MCPRSRQRLRCSANTPAEPAAANEAPLQNQRRPSETSESRSWSASAVEADTALLRLRPVPEDRVAKAAVRWPHVSRVANHFYKPSFPHRFPSLWNMPSEVSSARSPSRSPTMCLRHGCGQTAEEPLEQPAWLGLPSAVLTKRPLCSGRYHVLPSSRGQQVAAARSRRRVREAALGPSGTYLGLGIG